MGLVGIKGKPRSIDTQLIKYALRHAPSLIIDCSNTANPHRFYEYESAFSSVSVIEVQLLYGLRDTLLHEFSEQRIIITSFEHLFHHGDKTENRLVYQHIWELLQGLQYRHDILVSIPQGQITLAQQYCQEVWDWDIPYGVNDKPSITL